MSASKSKTKETTAQTQTSSGTATTTPNTPDWLAQPWQQQVANIGALQGSGQPLISGASPLQQQAFSAASSLTGSNDGRQVNGGGGDGFTTSGNGFDLAASLGMTAANAPANTATATGYGAQGYSAAGPAATQGYSAPSLGGPAQAANRNLTDVDLAGYYNPYRQEVIDTSTADFDASAGRARAAQTATAAMNGGARNSNNSIESAILGGEIERGRGSLISGLRSAGFDKATGLAQTDLARETANSQFNAGQTNGFNLSKAGMEADAARFGADAANRSALDYTGRTDAAGQFGANAANTASQFGAGAANTAGMFNAGQQDNAITRMLQAAGLISSNATASGNMDLARSADTRADIGLTAELGGQQRDIANSQSPAANLALIQQLLGGVPLEAFLGQTETRNQTGSGTGTGSSTSSGVGFNLADLWAASNSGGR